MPPPSGILGRLQERAANSSANDLARRIQQTDRLRRAEELLHREQARGNELAREAQRYSEAGMHTEAAQAAAAHERQLQRLNRAEETHREILESQRGAMSRLAQSTRQYASQRLSSGITTVVTATAQKMRGQIERAHHALLQNTRNFSDITNTGLANAVAGYTGALAQAIDIGIKYGQSVDEITQIQHNLVEAMNIDVHQGGWVESVSAITDDFANMASRAGRTVAEVAQVQMEMSRTFGRGSQSEMEAFANQMSRVSMIPEVLRQELEAAGGQAGQLFNNREMALMIEHWTTQFGQQSMNIEEMAANMMDFRKQADAAKYSVHGINVMTQAFAAGTIGRQGTDYNTVTAGRALQQQFRGDAAMRERMLSNLEGRDVDNAIELANSGSALAASDFYHMMKGTTAGVQAITDSLIGFYNTDLPTATRMLQQQGFDTGDANLNRQLADLLRQQHERPAEARTADIQRLIDMSASREQEQQQARDNQYTNIALTAQAAETGAELMSELVTNTSSGGAIVAGLAGVAAVVARAFPSVGNEWRDLFMGRVSASTTPQATNRRNVEMEAGSAAGRDFIRQQLQTMHDSGQDMESGAGRRQVVGLVSRAFNDLTEDDRQSVLQKLQDLGIDYRSMAIEARTLAESGRAGTGAENTREAYHAARRSAATSARMHAAPPETGPTALNAVTRRETARREERERRRQEDETPAATIPTTPNRADTANQVIQQGSTPASTPASAPAPAAPAPAAPATGASTRGAALTPAGPARGTLASNGDLSVTVPVTFSVQQFTGHVAEANARNASTNPFGNRTA